VAVGETTKVIEELGDAFSLLTVTEIDRAQRIRSPADRADFIAAHGLIRLVSAKLLRGDPRDVTIVQQCPDCGGPHGQPNVVGAPDLNVSWSHTHGFVAAIAGFVPVAVDVEHPPLGAPDAVLQRLVLSPQERLVVAGAADPAVAFVRYWVRKESLVKLGLSTLDTLATSGPHGLSVEPSWSAATGQLSSRQPFAWRRLAWREWQLVEWSDPVPRTMGTAIAAVAPSLLLIGM